MVFDDFYGGVRYSMILRICDKFPLLLDCKGGASPCMADTIIFTSNKPPNEWWKNLLDLSAFERRITHLVEFKMTPLGVIYRFHKGGILPIH